MEGTAVGAQPIGRIWGVSLSKLAWATVAVAAGFAIAALALQIATLDTETPPAWGFRGFAIVIGLTFAAVGGVVASRTPSNLIGWLLLAAGLSSSAQALIFEYTVFTLLARPGSLPGGDFLAWVDSWVWVISMGIATTLVFLLFPDGRPPSPRWRVLVWFSLGSIVFAMVGIALISGDFIKFESARSPIVIDALIDKPWLVGFVTFPLVGAIVSSGVSLVVRYKSVDSDIERHQLRWFAFSGVLAATAVVVNQVEIAIRSSSSQDTVTDGFLIAAALTVPVAIGIAVLRYRLYDIDLIINRTLIYGPLTATLAGTYTASIIFFRLIFVDVLNVSSDAAVASTTLLLAALFVPVRNRFQQLVDKLFKEDEYRRLVAFSTEAAHAVDLMDQEAVARRFLTLAVEATGTKGCTIVLKGTGRTEREFTVGANTDSVQAVLSLTLEGVEVGQLKLGPKENGYENRDAEVATLQRAANLVVRSLSYHQSP